MLSTKFKGQPHIQCRESQLLRGGGKSSPCHPPPQNKPCHYSGIIDMLSVLYFMLEFTMNFSLSLPPSLPHSLPPSLLGLELVSPCWSTLSQLMKMMLVQLGVLAWWSSGPFTSYPMAPTWLSQLWWPLTSALSWSSVSTCSLSYHTQLVSHLPKSAWWLICSCFTAFMLLGGSLFAYTYMYSF